MLNTAVASFTMDVVMISLKACEEVLNKNRRKYSDSEIKIIREILTKLSEIEYEFYEQVQRSKEGSHLH
jgi:thiaminase